jgi:nucleoid-associated protein YgaU
MATPASYPTTPPGGYSPPGAYDNATNSLGAASQHNDRGRRDDGTYEVQPNDNYWLIAQKIYNNGAFYKALAEVNRLKSAQPDRLAPGQVISTPPVAELRKNYPDLCPRPGRREAVHNHSGVISQTALVGGGRVYVVQEGDTLSSIAHYELGKISRWAEIYELNREAIGKEYNYLTPGMQLVMPSKEKPSSDRMTRQPEDSGPYRR